MPNVPASGVGAPTPLDSGHRPVPPIQAGLAGKTQALRLAYQGSAGNAYRMDFSPREQLPVRLCNKVPSRQQGTAGMLEDSRALHQDRLCRRATSGDLRRSLVDLLPRAEEGHRQDAGLHRPPQIQRAHRVRALQDGGLAHDPAAHPPQRLHHEGGPVRLLHALPHRQVRSEVHAVHVGGQEVSVQR